MAHNCIMDTLKMALIMLSPFSSDLPHSLRLNENHLLLYLDAVAMGAFRDSYERETLDRVAS